MPSEALHAAVRRRSEAAQAQIDRLLQLRAENPDRVGTADELATAKAEVEFARIVEQRRRDKLAATITGDQALELVLGLAADALAILHTADLLKLPHAGFVQEANAVTLVRRLVAEGYRLRPDPTTPTEDPSISRLTNALRKEVAK